MDHGTGQGRGRAAAGRVRESGRALALLLLTTAAAPAPVVQQQRPSGASTRAEAAPPADAVVAGALMTTARVSRPRRAACGEPGPGGEIVVCGADHGEQWRVPSTTDSDRGSHQAMDTGVPAAPNVSSLPDCRRGCLGFGKAPPPLYIIDLRKMPEAPAGSDADRIAKGELSER